MKTIQFVFDCLDGKYEFTGEAKNNLIFSIESTIEALPSLEGELDENKTKQFFEQLSLSGIEKWDRHYPSTLSAIEDCVRWYVKYTDDDKVYVSDGEESYEPYNYNHLIEALKLCDENAQYFMI